MDTLGLNFAPTADNAAMGPRNAGLAGVPQAIQVLSMALPHVIGAKSIAPGSVLTSPGSSGNPAIDSALLRTLLQALGLPGGTAGPNTSGPGPLNPAPGAGSRGLSLPYQPPADTGLPTAPNLGAPSLQFIPNPTPPPFGGGNGPMNPAPGGRRGY